MSQDETRTTSPSQAKPPTFEEALARLDRIVHDLEDGGVSLAESLTRYEEGIGLLKLCYAQLEQAERRVEMLSGFTADGQPVVTPLDDAAAEVTSASATKRRRRAAPAGDADARSSADSTSPRDSAPPPHRKLPERELPGLFEE